MNANANAGARTQANALTHLDNAEFYVPKSNKPKSSWIERERINFLWWKHGRLRHATLGPVFWTLEDVVEVGMIAAVKPRVALEGKRASCQGILNIRTNVSSCAAITYASQPLPDGQHYVGHCSVQYYQFSTKRVQQVQVLRLTVCYTMRLRRVDKLHGWVRALWPETSCYQDT